MDEAGGEYYQEKEKEEEVDDVKKKVERYHMKSQELLRMHKYSKAINYCQFSLNLMKGKSRNVSVNAII